MNIRVKIILTLAIFGLFCIFTQEQNNQTLNRFLQQDSGCGSKLDQNASCGYWSDTDQCNQNPGYMDVNCAKSCCEIKAKQQNSKPQTAKNNCDSKEDFNKSCQIWSEQNQCSQNAGYMLTQCAKSCCEVEKKNQQQPTPLDKNLPVLPSKNQNCNDPKDYDENCKLYADNNMCKDNGVFMNQFCKKTCCALEDIQKPTEKPTQKPTEKPTEKPTQKPTEKPTQQPTEKPTDKQDQKNIDLCQVMPKDSKSNCYQNALKDQCNKSNSQFKWMTQNCPKTCCEFNNHKCGTVSADKKSCQAFVDKGFCTNTQQAQFMNLNCARSCCFKNIK